MWTGKTLVRLGGCPGWSESSLGAHSLYWFCHVAAHILLHESITSNTSKGVGPQVLPTLVTALPLDKFTELCSHMIMATFYYFILTKIYKFYQTYLLKSSIKTYLPIHFFLQKKNKKTTRSFQTGKKNLESHLGFFDRTTGDRNNERDRQSLVCRKKWTDIIWFHFVMESMKLMNKMNKIM